VPIEKYEVLPQLGRFTLRDEGKTIGQGCITKYKPANPASLVKKMAEAKIVDGTSKTIDSVYDSETGQVVPAKKPMESIAEE
jgi:hypothetical protein